MVTLTHREAMPSQPHKQTRVRVGGTHKENDQLKRIKVVPDVLVPNPNTDDLALTAYLIETVHSATFKMYKPHIPSSPNDKGSCQSPSNSGPWTPTTPCIFPPSVARSIMTPLGNGLFRFLSCSTRTPCGRETIDALCEYAWCSLAAGRRMRDWCAELGHILSALRKFESLVQLLKKPPLAILVPFTRLTSPYFPSSPSFPPPLLGTHLLPVVTRRQLIVILVRLSHQPSLQDEGVEWEKLIFEVCVEYIGRRWRMGEDDLVEGIAKKLTEVEVEIQLQGELANIRSVILPAVQKVRCFLGFLSSTQLVIRLNALSRLSSGKANNSNQQHAATQLIDAYVIRRLAGGIDPSTIASGLSGAAEKLTSKSKSHAITTSLGSFGLAPSLASTSTDLGPTPSSTDSLPSPVSEKRSAFSLFTDRLSRRRTQTPPRWSTDARGGSASRVHLPTFNPDRRPSLPTHLLHTPHSSFSPFSNMRSPLAESTSSLKVVAFSDAEQEAEIMAMRISQLNPASARDLLVHQTLLKRYRVASNGGWYLGGGRSETSVLVDRIAERLGTLGIEYGERVLAALRHQFDLNRASITDGTPTTIINQPSVTEPRFLPGSEAPPLAPSLLPVASPSLLLSRPVISPLSSHTFDLEEYYSRPSRSTIRFSSDSMVTQLSKRSSTLERDLVQPTRVGNALHRTNRCSSGRNSFFMDDSALSDSTHNRHSKMSNFAILEATREWPLSSMAYLYHMSSIEVDNEEDEYPATTQDEEEESSLSSNHRFCLSEPDLLAQSHYTTIPPRPTSLRRTKRIPPSGLPILANDLCLTDIPSSRDKTSSVLFSDTTLSQSPALFTFASPNPSLLIEHRHTTNSPPSTPPYSQASTPKAIAFPLPPTDLPSPPMSNGKKERGQWHRQCAIVDGEHVSPQRGCANARPEQTEAEGDAGLHPNEEKPHRQSAGVATPPSSGADPVIPQRSTSLAFRQTAEGPDTDLPSAQLSTPRKRTERAVHFRDTLRFAIEETPLSLALSLFTTKTTKAHSVLDISLFPLAGTVNPRPGLSMEELNEVLDAMVECEKRRLSERGLSWDFGARCRIGWLIDQVGELLNEPRFTQVTNHHLDRLAPPSSPITNTFAQPAEGYRLSLLSTWSQDSFYSTNTTTTIVPDWHRPLSDHPVASADISTSVHYRGERLGDGMVPLLTPPSSPVSHRARLSGVASDRLSRRTLPQSPPVPVDDYPLSKAPTKTMMPPRPPRRGSSGPNVPHNCGTETAVEGSPPIQEHVQRRRREEEKHRERLSRVSTGTFGQ